MKKLLSVLLLAALLLCACAPKAQLSGEEAPAPASAAEAAPAEPVPDEEPVSPAEYPFPTFEYTHFASGGTAETYTAVILFEEANSTFTSYQVAFSSCTCRDSSVNYYSVAYVELLNNKASPEDAAIRTITFGENKGLWGDSNPNYYIADYTEEYYDEHFVQSLVRLTKADIDAWGGYGTQVEGIVPDAVSGATVSTSNITSMLQGLFRYHTARCYGE